MITKLFLTGASSRFSAITIKIDNGRFHYVREYFYRRKNQFPNLPKLPDSLR